MSLLERRRLCLPVGEVAIGCKALEISKRWRSTEKCTGGACLDLQVDAESCYWGSGGFVGELYGHVAVRGTAEELKAKPAVQHCHFPIFQCVCAPVSMSTSHEKQNPNKHEANILTSMEPTSFPTVKHFSVGPRNPPFLLQLDPSQPLISSDLIFLEKGHYCWSHSNISVTCRAVQYFILPSGRCSPGHREQEVVSLLTSILGSSMAVTCSCQ